VSRGEFEGERLEFAARQQLTTEGPCYSEEFTENRILSAGRHKQVSSVCLSYLLLRATAKAQIALPVNSPLASIDDQPCQSAMIDIYIRGIATSGPTRGGHGQWPPPWADSNAESPCGGSSPQDAPVHLLGTHPSGSTPYRRAPDLAVQEVRVPGTAA